jgi:ComF family protein
MRLDSAKEFRDWLEAGLSFFYPEVCQYCGEERATAPEGFIGARCWENLKFITPPYCDRCGLPFEGAVSTPFECTNCREMELHFSWARSAVAARGMALDIIHRYKYQRALWFEPFLGDLLVRQAATSLRGGQWNLIVPVPLHGLKQSEREFNQAERLARYLGRAAQIPLRTDLLRRVAPTHTQTLLSRAERAANVRRAFAVRDGGALKNRRVVVVDDVFTTGATTSACANILLANGAADVCVWTLARGLLN